MLRPRIYWERLRFHRPFIFSVISSRQKDSISVCLHKRAPPFQQLENFLFDCPSNMGRRKKKKKNKKKRKERYTVKKEGGRGEEREREGTVKPSAKFPFYRRDAKVSTTIASFTWWQWKKKGFVSNTIIFLFPSLFFHPLTTFRRNDR